MTASRTHEKVRSAARVRSLASPGRLSVSICSGEDPIPGRTRSKVCQNVCVFGSWKPASAHADIHLSVLGRNGAHTAQSQTLTLSPNCELYWVASPSSVCLNNTKKKRNKKNVEPPYKAAFKSNLDGSVEPLAIRDDLELLDGDILSGRGPVHTDVL